MTFFCYQTVKNCEIKTRKIRWQVYIQTYIYENAIHEITQLVLFLRQLSFVNSIDSLQVETWATGDRAESRVFKTEIVTMRRMRAHRGIGHDRKCFYFSAWISSKDFQRLNWAWKDYCSITNVIRKFMNFLEFWIYHKLTVLRKVFYWRIPTTKEYILSSGTFAINPSLERNIMVDVSFQLETKTNLSSPNEHLFTSLSALLVLCHVNDCVHDVNDCSVSCKYKATNGLPITTLRSSTTELQEV